jgi:hypothetical protein
MDLEPWLDSLCDELPQFDYYYNEFSIFDIPFVQQMELYCYETLEDPQEEDTDSSFDEQQEEETDEVLEAGVIEYRIPPLQKIRSAESNRVTKVRNPRVSRPHQCRGCLETRVLSPTSTPKCWTPILKCMDLLGLCFECTDDIIGKNYIDNDSCGKVFPDRWYLVNRRSLTYYFSRNYFGKSVKDPLFILRNSLNNYKGIKLRDHTWNRGACFGLYSLVQFTQYGESWVIKTCCGGWV